MIMDPLSSLGSFAVVWMALCVLSSALVVDAMLRKGRGGADGAALILDRDRTERSKSE